MSSLSSSSSSSLSDDRKTSSAAAVAATAVQLDDDIESEFRWKTIFTDLESRGLSGADFFRSNTNAGSQFDRDVESLMEAYLNRAGSAEKALFEKAAIARCKSFDEDDADRLRSALRFAFYDGTDADIRRFWTDQQFRLATVRAVAVRYGIDSTVPIDRLRLLVFRKAKQDFINPMNCGSCGTAMPSSGQVCCNGICVDIPLSSTYCGSCVSTIPACNGTCIDLTAPPPPPADGR